MSRLPDASEVYVVMPAAAWLLVSSFAAIVAAGRPHAAIDHDSRFPTGSYVYVIL